MLKSSSSSSSPSPNGPFPSAPRSGDSCPGTPTFSCRREISGVSGCCWYEHEATAVAAVAAAAAVADAIGGRLRVLIAVLSKLQESGRKPRTSSNASPHSKHLTAAIITMGRLRLMRRWCSIFALRCLPSAHVYSPSTLGTWNNFEAKVLVLI